MAKKQSIVSMARGAVYLGAIAAPGVTTYRAQIAAGRPMGEAVGNTVKAYAGINSANQFDWGVLAFHVGPIAAWTAIDTLASKFGVWRKVGRLIGSF